MEKFILAGVILVCDANLPAGCTFYWAGSLKSTNNTIDIIAFRTNKTSDFEPIIKKDLEALRAMKQTDNVKAQISFILRILHAMSDKLFVHVPDKNLLNTVANGLKLSSLTANDVVYLSGVSQIIK